MRTSPRTVARIFGSILLASIGLNVAPAHAYQLVNVYGWVQDLSSGGPEATFHDISDPALGGTATALSNSATGWGGTSYASANLETGELKVSTTSHEPGYRDDLGRASAGGLSIAQAEIRDAIHIVGDIFAPMTATLTAHVSGTLDGADSDGRFYMFFFPLVEQPSQELTYAFETTADGSCIPSATKVCLVGSSFSFDVVIEFLISDLVRDFYIAADLLVNSWAGASADFSHTAALELNLPPGLSFTSESGVFLASVATAVPEPSTAGILAAGLTFVAFLRRRRCTGLLSGLLVLCIASAAQATPVELLQNGSFETSNASSWLVTGPHVGGCATNFVVSNSGSGASCTGFAPIASTFVAPLEGTFAAYASFDGDGPLHHTITQSFAVSGSLNWAEVSWAEAIGFGNGWIFPIARVYDVRLLDASGQLVATLFSQSFTNQVGGILQDWTVHTADISSYLSLLGGLGHLQFDLYVPQIGTGPGAFGLDAVSIMADGIAIDVPEPSSALVLSMGLIGLAFCRRNRASCSEARCEPGRAAGWIVALTWPHLDNEPHPHSLNATAWQQRA